MEGSGGSLVPSRSHQEQAQAGKHLVIEDVRVRTAWLDALPPSSGNSSNLNSTHGGALCQQQARRFALRPPPRLRRARPWRAEAARAGRKQGVRVRVPCGLPSQTSRWPTAAPAAAATAATARLRCRARTPCCPRLPARPPAAARTAASSRAPRRRSASPTPSRAANGAPPRRASAASCSSSGAFGRYPPLPPSRRVPRTCRSRRAAGSRTSRCGWLLVGCLFRPAAGAALDDDALALAVPAWTIKGGDDAEQQGGLYFMTIEVRRSGCLLAAPWRFGGRAVEAGWVGR